MAKEVELNNATHGAGEVERDDTVHEYAMSILEAVAIDEGSLGDPTTLAEASQYHWRHWEISILTEPGCHDNAVCSAETTAKHSCRDSSSRWSPKAWDLHMVDTRKT